jgi:AcrR family transcriptional regulator
VSSSRERILANARALVEAGAGAPLNMSALAKASGISRQALYLHFPDRASLLLALVDFVDAREDLDAELETVRAAPDGPSRLRAVLEMQARRNPRIIALVRSIDAARRGDTASSQAWTDRHDGRYQGAAAITAMMRAEGHVDPSWSDADATALLWELTSIRVWDDLVNDRGLTPERYVAMMQATALAALAGPSS